MFFKTTPLLPGRHLIFLKTIQWGRSTRNHHKRSAHQSIDSWSRLCHFQRYIFLQPRDFLRGHFNHKWTNVFSWGILYEITNSESKPTKQNREKRLHGSGITGIEPNIGSPNGGQSIVFIICKLCCFSSHVSDCTKMGAEIIQFQPTNLKIENQTSKIS